MPRRSTDALHWSDCFPELRARADDPLLELIRLSALSPDGDAPLAMALSELETGLERSLELGAPGTVERSFDETWLLAVFAALAQVDLPRYQFLLRSRLKAGAAARAHFALTQAQVWLETRL